MRCTFPLVLLLGLLAGCRTPRPQPGRVRAPIQLRDTAGPSGFDYRFSHGGKTPLTILETSGFGGGWLDYDRDGQPDILITAHDGSHLFRNVGGRFTRVPDAAGLPTTGTWLGPAVGDFDNDGWSDVFLTGYGEQRLYRNRSGRFEDVTRTCGLAQSGHWNTSAAFIDYDNDGFLDLFVCRYVRFGAKSRQYCEERGLRIACPPAEYPADRSVMYHSVRGTRFEPVFESILSKSAGKSWGVLPVDVDDDGWTDLYVANDEEPSELWKNERGRALRNVGYEAGLALGPNGRAYGGMGASAGDFDGDGRTDLFLSTFTDETKSVLLNVGNGSFRDASSEYGLEPLRPLVAWGNAAVDFDLDGWLDLLVVSGHIADNRAVLEPGLASSAYRQPAKLFRGRGAKGFEEIPAPAAGIEHPLVGRGLAAGDYDSDGKPDVLVVDLEGPALLLHNESPTSQHHWIGFELQGVRTNRLALGSVVRLSSGGRSREVEIRTAGSVLSACDPRARFGLGTETTIDSVQVRWASGHVQQVASPQIDRYNRVREE